MTRSAGTELTMFRSLEASIEAVYRALTSEYAVGRWFGPSDDFTVTVHEWDCRIGGRYRVQFDTLDGERHIVVGEFQSLIPNREVSYSWSWEGQQMDTRVTFRLEAKGETTELRLSHTGFGSADEKGHHEQGWTGSLDRLEREVRPA